MVNMERLTPFVSYLMSVHSGLLSVSFFYVSKVVILQPLILIFLLWLGGPCIAILYQILLLLWREQMLIVSVVQSFACTQFLQPVLFNFCNILAVCVNIYHTQSEEFYSQGEESQDSPITLKWKRIQDSLPFRNALAPIWSGNILSVS